MTNEKQEETGPTALAVGVCGSCHTLFLISPERQTSPCHGADPLMVVCSLLLEDDGSVSGQWGCPLPALAPDIREEPAPAPAPPEEPPAEEAEEAEEGPVETALDVARSTLALYVALDLHNADEVREALQDAGAEPEAASTAVGRLAAVRELLQTLEPPREAVPVAPAPPEAESSPETSPQDPLTDAAAGV